MTPDQDAHCESLIAEFATDFRRRFGTGALAEALIAEFAEDMRLKYRTGQAEHGGNLWEQPGLIDRAIEESDDLQAYLRTMRSAQGVKSGFLVRAIDRADELVYCLRNLRRQLTHLYEPVPNLHLLEAPHATDGYVLASRTGPDGFSERLVPRAPTEVDPEC